jgi:YesN/AraC family two-component response regulator
MSKILSSGCSHYLAKPFTKEVLLQSMWQFLGRSNSPSETKRHEVFDGQYFEDDSWLDYAERFPYRYN